MKKISFFLLLSFFVTFAYSQPEGFTAITKVKTTPPKDQARAGTCWSFATVSFIETEVLRITEKEFDLSETFPVYYAYLDKAEMYIRLQGLTNFGQGGQAHDVMNVIKEYGIVPEAVYPYTNKDHTKLEKKLKNYLDSILKLDSIPRKWIDGYQKILDKGLGVPPTKFTFEGKDYTPRSFVTQVLEFNPNNYIELTSFNHHEFYQEFALEVPDNWSRDLYYNVSLDDLMKIIEEALMNGYSVDWDGDVSEKTFDTKTGMATLEGKGGNKKMQVLAPQSFRQTLFDRQFTTDDHLMHAVGIFKGPFGGKFYLIKNSWGEYPPFDGYIYMSEDFVMYKTIAILVHKDAIPELIKEKLKID
ncbi:MAG: aminopeptidase [Bacteroidales bacterium]|nr:aminopeptidase [Bacteroidales bacterium]